MGRPAPKRKKFLVSEFIECFSSNMEVQSNFATNTEVTVLVLLDVGASISSINHEL